MQSNNSERKTYELHPMELAEYTRIHNMRKIIPTNLTLDEFRSLAERKPNLDGSWIYRLTRTVICEITKEMYPEFDVYEEMPIWFLSYSEAQANTAELVSSRDEESLSVTYCFHIVQIPLGCPAEHGARWLYDASDTLLDYSITSWTGDPLSVRFFGRPNSRQRFKRGEIVEVLSKDKVSLALLVEHSPSIEWCWDLYQRCNREDEEERMPYFLDASDDCCYLIDGPGYEYHSHVSPLLIMKPRFPIPDEFERKMKGWLEKIDKSVT